MFQAELLKRLVDVLDRLGVSFMLTGSVASSLQGEPRASHDIDVVVDLPADRIDDLMNEFPSPRYYLSRDAMRDAVARQSMFNLLDTQEGDKVDFWLLTDAPFDQSRFSRREFVAVDDLSLPVSRPEDTILMKLRWSQEAGGSERQFQDALRVFEIQCDNLDMNYLDHWKNELKLADCWNRLLEEAQPLE